MRAKNEIPYVSDAIELLKQQSWPSFDLFAIDSGSTDGTLKVLQDSSANLVQIKPSDYVPGKVLNDAIARTSHDIVVLLNADAIPQSNDWLKALISPIIANTADATYSKQIPRPNARFVVAYDYERAYDSTKMDSGFFSAVACAFKHDLWQKIPFREKGYAEDLAWAISCIETGARFNFQNQSVVEHSHNYTLKELWHKRYRQAVTFDEPSNIGKQVYLFFRELIRDLLHAIAKFKLHTIPYNISYRFMIYRGLYCGLRDAGRRKTL